MGETVEAIGYRTDVKSRTKDWVEDKTEGLRDTAQRIGGSASRARSSLAEATPDSRDIKEGGRRAVSMAEDNPIGLAIGAAAAGFLIGLALPRTEVEDEKLGPTSDQVKEQAAELGREAVERGQTVAEQAARSAADAAKDEAQRQAEQLKDSAHESIEDLKP
jgi:hypothetical protein